MSGHFYFVRDHTLLRLGGYAVGRRQQCSKIYAYNLHLLSKVGYPPLQSSHVIALGR